MALYTKAQMLTQVRALLNETTALLWTDAELDNYLCWGARTLSGITLCVPASEVVNGAGNSSWVAGSLSAPLTTNFIKVASVTTTVILAGTPINLQRADIRNFGHGAPAADATNQTPQWYYMFGNRIFFWPCPKGTTVTSGTGGNLTVYGFRAAWDYDHEAAGAAGTYYDIPDSLQARLIDFVLACAYVKAGKYSLTRAHMQNFMQNAMMDRRDVFESNGIVDSLDRFMIPDRTQQAQAG